MACTYTYEGVEYSKEELIDKLTDVLYKDLGSKNVFRSIKTKSSDIVADTAKMLAQRYTDSKNMIQAVKQGEGTKEEKLKKIAYYKDILDKTSAARKELLELSTDKQIDYILGQANIDAKVVEALLLANDKATFSELRYANDIVETWKNLHRAMGLDTIYDIADPTIRAKAIEINNKYLEYSQRMNQLGKELLRQSGLKDFKITETSFATQWVRELSTAGIPLTNELAKIIKTVNFRINKEHNENYSAIDNKFDLIKDHPLFKQMGWDLFTKTQKDKSGNDVLGLTTKYSQNFFNKLIQASQLRKLEIDKAGGDRNKVKEAWKKYNRWNEENTSPFNAVPFLEMATHTDAERDTEISRMKGLGFNQSEIDSIILESEKLNSRFKYNKDEYESRVLHEAAGDPSVIPTGMTIDEYVKEKVDDYDDLNNPVKYMNQKFTKGTLVTAYAGSRYTYLIPAKEVFGKPSNYYDENFAKIAADPKLYEFYDWFKGFMDENLGWLPEEETDGLQSNFLPIIADRIVKEYGFTQLKESVKGLGDWFMKALTANNYEQQVETAAFSKKERRSFKARFINENVAIEDRSKDLTIMAKMFSDMALIYKHKNAVSAQVDVLNDVIQNTEGTYKMNKVTGIMEAVDRNAVKLKSLADATVKRSFYGLRAEDNLYKSDTLFYSFWELITGGLWRSKKGKQAKILQDEIQKINKDLDDDTLPEADRIKLEIDLEERKAEFYKLGGRKFSLTAAIDSSIKGTRMTALGFAPFSAMRNLLVGKINNNIHATGGRDFSKKDLAYANKTIIQASGKYWSGGKYETRMTKLLFGLMHDSQMAEGEDGMYLKTMVDKHTSIDKLREMLPTAYTWLSSGDYHFKGEMLLACMKHEMIKTSKGDVSFIDVLDENREYNEAEYGPWDEAANGGMSFEDFYTKKMLGFKQLANKLHGATGKDVYVQGKDNAITRLLMLFKSWLPETVGVRFDPKHKDALLDRDEEGYYRTFIKQIRDKKLGIVKMMIQTMFNKDNGITDPMELANFKKATKELQIIVGLLMAYMLLKAMAPDDDEKKKMYNLLVLRQLHDLNRDLLYYSDIHSISDLQSNVFPIIRTALNWEDAIKAVSYHLAGVEKDNGDEMYDDERTALKITKVLPVFSNINKVNYYMKDISSGGRGY